MSKLARVGACLVFALATALPACTERVDGGDESPDGGPPDLLALSIEPAETELVSVDGSMPSVALRAFARTARGETLEVEPESWLLSHDRIGSIDALGVFTASGRAGGVVEVIARMPGAIAYVEARATIRVRVELTVPEDPAAVPPVVRERFESFPEVDDPFEAPAIVYPLEGARMPNNVGAPDVQWDPIARAGDGYRLTVETPYASVRAYAYDDGRTFRAHFPIDRHTWRIVADSALGEEVSFRVDRIASGSSEIARGEPVHVWLSEDGVFGTVYYWQVRIAPQASDVLRLDTATGERQSVFGSDLSGGCVGCHALSHDGAQLAATLDSRAATWTTAVVDPSVRTGAPPDLMGPFNPGYHFFAYSPDATRILASRAISPDSHALTWLVMLDGATGAELTVSGLPTGVAGFPAWSPDGAFVAWMDGGGDGPSGTREPTRIAVSPVLDADTLGEPVFVHEGASLASSPEGGSTDARPTWSPDSRWIAFAHGTSSVSAVALDTEAPTSSLYLVPREGGAPIRLARGMGPGTVEAFWPVFSPFATAEDEGPRLFWLAFYSRQDYGNARAGTAGTSRRQLWVMAIDPDAAERGEDPSSPPYWLPGQDPRADDIAAIWAPTSCLGRDAPCTASSECCSGECAAADPSMPDVLTCRPPPVCRRAGESCEDERDCCGGLACELSVCGYQPPE